MFGFTLNSLDYYFFFLWKPLIEPIETNSKVNNLTKTVTKPRTAIIIAISKISVPIAKTN